MQVWSERWKLPIVASQLCNWRGWIRVVCFASRWCWVKRRMMMDIHGTRQMLCLWKPWWDCVKEIVMSFSLSQEGSLTSGCDEFRPVPGGLTHIRLWWVSACPKRTAKTHRNPWVLLRQAKTTHHNSRVMMSFGLSLEDSRVMSFGLSQEDTQVMKSFGLSQEDSWVMKTVEKNRWRQTHKRDDVKCDNVCVCVVDEAGLWAVVLLIVWRSVWRCYRRC